MSTKRRYKIINDTIKPLKLNSKGQDMRPNRDKTGSAVQFYTDESPSAKLVTIYQNKSTIVDELTNQIMGLHKRGKIIIETINDITDELKSFSVKPENGAPTNVYKAPEKKIPVEDTHKPIPDDIKAKATPSGDVAHEEKLVNPDGEPNFVVKAPRGGLKKKVEVQSEVKDSTKD